MHICASSHLQRWNYVYCVYIFYCCNELKNSQQQRTFKYICRCTPEDVGCPKSTTFWSQQWCASLTTKAWSRLLHFDLLVKIFAFTPRYCINQVTCLLHACCWVITVCLKTFNLFEVFLRPSEPPSPSNVEAGVAWQRLDRLDNDPPKLSISTLVNSSPVVLTTS